MPTKSQKAIKQINKLNIKGISASEAKKGSFTPKQKAAIKRAREQLR